LLLEDQIADARTEKQLFVDDDMLMAFFERLATEPSRKK